MRPPIWGATLLWGMCALSACDTTRAEALRALKSDDPSVRTTGVRRLAELGQTDAVDRLAPLLKDRSARVRRAAVAAVGALGLGGHWHGVVERLRDDDLQVRLAAVRVLGDSGDRRAQRALLPMLRDPSMVVRRAAEVALQALGVPRGEQVRRIAEQRLEERLAALDAADAQIRATAAEDIGHSGQRRCVTRLIERLDDRSPLVVRAAARALGRLGGERAGGALAELAAAPAEEARRAAAEGLSWIADPPVRVLRLLLDDDAPAVVLAVVHGLARGGRCPEVQTRICSLLRADDGRALWAARVAGRCSWSCDETARRLAASAADPLDSHARRLQWILAHLPDSELTRTTLTFADRLLRVYRAERSRWVAADRWGELGVSQGASSRPVLPDRPPRSSRKAREWLLARFPERKIERSSADPLLPPRVEVGQLSRLIERLAGRPAARRWLAELAAAERDDGALRVVALRALAAFARPGEPGPSDDPARQAVSLALKGESAVLRGAALQACGLLGPSVAPRAIRLLADRDFEVRAAAARCLGTLRALQAVEPLLAALASEQSLAVVVALGQIGDRRAARPISQLLQEDHAAARQDERVTIVEALGRLGDPAAAAVVERELAHPRWEVRLAAARALTRIGRAASRPLLKACQQDYYAEIRRACREALSALPDHQSQ